MTEESPVVVVWRGDVLPGSETFIRDQTDGLRRWTPLLWGARRVISSLSRPGDRIFYSRSLWDRAALLLARITGVAPRLEAALRDSGATVVHAHFVQDAWLIRRSARRAGLPLVVTCHGVDVTAWPTRPGTRWRARRVLSDATLVLAVSRFIAARARGLGAPAPVVLHTGVLPRPPHPRTGAADIVFVGRLVEKKGVADLLAALPLVERQIGRSPRVLIVGDGPLRADLEALAGPGVVFRGALAPEEVVRVLADAHVFVGPSRPARDGDAEGFGQVFLEAAVAGLPVVAYRSGGVPEAVVDGVTGLLAGPGDIPGLAGHIAALLADGDLAARLGRQGQVRARTEFSLAAGCARLEELYDRAATAGYTSG